jgi:hypothetical protein
LSATVPGNWGVPSQELPGWAGLNIAQAAWNIERVANSHTPLDGLESSVKIVDDAPV